MNLSPAARISLGLVFLTASLLVVGDLIGLTPNASEEFQDARRKYCESLAVMISLEVQNDQLASIQQIMQVAVERNDEILSMALRTADGQLVSQAGVLDTVWDTMEPGASSATHWRVPIVKGEQTWATVEVGYSPLPGFHLFGIPINPLARLIIFIGLAGFISYRFFIKKTLKHLDPSSVIPQQVQSTLDVLAEGVAIFDRDMHIVLANAALGKSVGKTSAQLLGRTAEDLGFLAAGDDGATIEFPWESAIRDGTSHTGIKLTRNTVDDTQHIYMVNGAPVLDGKGVVRGALATFDDMTQLEAKNSQLQKMLNLLKRSRDEVTRQNEQLQILATRDPLTGCFNRRAFFASFEQQFTAGVEEHLALTCIMADIDHFKSFNDRYGHSVGDDVIKRVSRSLQSTLREEDILCRYGGEEFCIVLPGLNIDVGVKVAERIRRIIDSQNEDELIVTCSFGVSALAFGAQSAADLIDQADKALYSAKENGRNQVVQWSASLEETPDDTAPMPVIGGTAKLQPADEQFQGTTTMTVTAPMLTETLLDHSVAHVSTLEEDNRWFMEALEIVASMNTMYGDAAVQSDDLRIYKVARLHLNRMMSLQASAFFSLDDNAATFTLSGCEPQELTSALVAQAEAIAATGDLQLAAQQNHPVDFVRQSDGQRFVLHALISDGGPFGIFIGMMENSSEALDYANSSLMSILVNKTASALASARLYAKLNDQKLNLEQALAERTREVQEGLVQDSLTGLPNRLLFRDRVDAAIKRAIRYNSIAAILLLDLDRFKRINTLLGQNIGDEVLKEAARRINSVLRTSDSVARIRPVDNGSVISRLGGDEFGILLTDLDSVNSISTVVDRLIASLGAAFRFNEREVFITSSIGISLCPADGDCAESLLRNAESAMYDAKQINHSNYQYYCSEANAQAVRSLDLEDKLRLAMKRNEFSLHYQPKVSLKSGTITGFEALLRWQQPDTKFISPAEFIPVAETSGLIGPIGAWALRTACTQARGWIDAGFEKIHVAVNLSAVQLRQKGILKQILAILDESGLPPGNLQLEVTESAVMQNLERAASILQELSDCGIIIAIDDFGTGYSSLNHIKRLPVDILKIDGSFVHEIASNNSDATIVTAIVAMAHGMGLKTVAECVETSEQMSFLETVGCDAIQGYYFSKPLPADDAMDFLWQERSNMPVMLKPYPDEPVLIEAR